MSKLINEILVIIYCATFQHEKFIKQTLESFLSQKTNFKFQIWIHDDASTDNTQKIICEYAEKYPDVIVPILEKENQYSKGIRIFHKLLPQMNARYIAFCEGDDYWTDINKLQQQIEILEKYDNYSACVHNSYIISGKKIKKRSLFNKETYSDEILEFKEVVMEGGASYHTSSLVCRKKYLDRIPEFYHKCRGIGDYPLAIWLTICGKIYFINKPMSVYRFQSCKTAWTSINGKNRQNRIMIQKKCINMLEAVIEYEEAEKIYPEHKIYLQKAIISHEIRIHEIQCNYKLIRSNYSDYYRERPMIYKLKGFIKENAYNLNLIRN